MALAGPIPYVDRTAAPTVHTGGDGSTWRTWPALPGVFYITDPATFARAAEALTPYRVEPALPLQGVLAGDDPAAPFATVTLRFPDAAAAAPIVAAVNALPPVPASPAVADPSPEPVRKTYLYRFKCALDTLGLLSIADALVAQADTQTKLYWGAPGYGGGVPEVLRTDPLLATMAAAMGKSSADVDAVFDLADTFR